MSKTLYRILQSLILFGLVAFLVERWLTGRLTWYINDRFTPLTLVAVLGFTGMAVAGLSGLRGTRKTTADPSQAGEEAHPDEDPDHIDEDHEHGHDHEHHQHGFSPAGLIWISIPLIIGIIFPASPLSASSLSTRSISANGLSAASAATSRVLDAPADKRTILDWIRLYNYASDKSTVIGQTADVIGFVYHDARLPDGQFMVSRFTISCCVADALAIGMVVDWPDAANLADNTWVRVVGPVQAGSLDGTKILRIQATGVDGVQQPIQPYLFP